MMLRACAECRLAQYQPAAMLEILGAGAGDTWPHLYCWMRWALDCSEGFISVRLSGSPGRSEEQSHVYIT